MSFLIRYSYYFLFLSFLLSENADHLIFNKICIKPAQAEMIEIYNPLDSDIDLTNYYLSDQDEYYKWVNGDMSSISIQDFLIRFPSGSIIRAQETLVITTQSSSDFLSYYDYEADISIIDTNFEESSIGTSANLSDSQEMLILFYWDGTSSIIQDVDYFLWGSYNKGVSKTILDDGYPYDDTLLENQIFIRNYSDSDFSDSLYIRNDINENNEIQSGGNGYTGHDETSENIVASWSIIGLEKEISFQDIINGDYDCAGSSQDGCPLGSLTDCPIVNPTGVIVDYFDITPYGGPHALTIEDDEGYRLELTIWPDNWDIANDPDYSTLLDPPYNRFLVQAFGNVFEYDGEKQILVCGLEDFEIIESYDMDGIFEEGIYSKASINPAPYVLLASEDERLDYSYSFPSNSRVIIRIFDISGRFMTTLVDKYYESSGVVKREELHSSWNGKNHIGQVLSPGTYLMHMEASNFQTGETMIDVAPVVIGVRNK